MAQERHSRKRRQRRHGGSIASSYPIMSAPLKKNVNTTPNSNMKDFIDLFANGLNLNRQVNNKNDMDITGVGNGSSYSLSLCAKSNGHQNLIPMSDFQIKHLPLDLRKTPCFNYIKQLSKFVGKIMVTYTSPKRYNSDKYELYGLPDRHVIRQGTGWVVQVLPNDVQETIPCPYPDCKFSNRPHYVTGPFYVMTACHVVFDEDEAFRTDIHFYDDVSTPDSTPKWTANGINVSYSSCPDRDCVFIQCFSHDPDIFTYLRSITNDMRIATMELMKANIKRTSGEESLFVISHPHGRAKHISFGSVTDKKVVEFESNPESGKKMSGRVLYTYEVSTCPGSSGAPVCIMGMDGAFYYQFPHSVDIGGVRGVNSGLVDWLIC